MAAKQALNIGVVGYGFMGRTHSNAYKRVNDFFDVAYRPVLKAVCGRTADRAKAFAENWGYQSVETESRKQIESRHIDASTSARPTIRTPRSPSPPPKRAR
jgi:predicted dehydrogenase